MNALSLIRALWPTSVPATEYERLLSAIALADGVAPEPKEPRARQPQTRLSPRTVKVGGRVGEKSRVERLRRLLQEKPMTIGQIQTELGVAYGTVYTYLRKLRFVKKVGQKFSVAKRKSPDGAGKHPRPAPGERAADKILSALSTGPATTRDLAHATGILLGTVSGTLSVLKQKGQVHVEHPKSENGLPAAPIYRVSA